MSNATQSLAGTRITSLLDANSFVEIGKSVTARSTDFNLTETKAPSDGVITGYGVIDGNLVYVYSQDASVLNGTVGEMHARKITALYDLAMKTGAPVIGLVDCAGMRLQEATDALEAFGSIYLKQTLASGVIPQITAVFGTCGGGMAVVPALTDFTFVEEKKGRLFVNTPNALEGNEISKCNTASADYQSKTAGLVDGIGAEAEILGQIRDRIPLGLELTGVKRNPSRRLRPDPYSMIHIIIRKSLFLNLLYRQIAGKLMNNCTNHLNMI